MKFDFESDGMDGLVLIDKGYLDEINEDILYSLDIYLDKTGKSELIYDFPDESWEDVRKRESVKLIEFCNSGRMVLFLTDKDETNCEIEIYNNNKICTNTFLNVPSGKIILVNAGELIQCLSYPDLEMEEIMELDSIEKGIYAIENDGIKKIICIKSSTIETKLNNIIEL